MTDEEALEILRTAYHQAVAKDETLSSVLYIRGTANVAGDYQLRRQNERTHHVESAQLMNKYIPAGLTMARVTDPFYKLCVAVQKELMGILSTQGLLKH